MIGIENCSNALADDDDHATDDTHEEMTVYVKNQQNYNVHDNDAIEQNKKVCARRILFASLEVE